MTPIRPLEWTAALAEPVAELSWSPENRWLAVGGVEGRVWILDAQSGQLIRDWVAHPKGLFRCSFSPTSDDLATSGQDGVVRVWDVERGECRKSLPCGSAWVENLAWSADGTWLAATAGRHLHLWRPDTTETHAVPASPSTLTAITWHSVHNELAVARFGGVELWNADTAERTTTLPWKTSLISVAWSPDGRWVVSGTQELSVQIWELPFRPGEELAMSGYTAKVRQLAWHHSGRYLATGGGTEIMVWDCGGRGPSGTSPRILTGHTAKLACLTYQKAGHLLASGGTDGVVQLWNAGKSSQALRQHRLGEEITALSWDRTDGRIAVGTHLGTVGVAAVPR